MTLSRCRVSLFFLFFQMLEAPTLQNVSFTVKPEQLVAVIGPVGAGKVCALGFQPCTQFDYSCSITALACRQQTHKNCRFDRDYPVLAGASRPSSVPSWGS